MKEKACVITNNPKATFLVKGINLVKKCWRFLFEINFLHD
jgi:hypothetical protein